jgi:hypothetical protein
VPFQASETTRLLHYGKPDPEVSIMQEPKSSLDAATVKFVRLGCKVSPDFHTGTIRDWPTAEAVIRALGENRGKFPTRRVLEALEELFPTLWAITAGLETGPVIYLALPMLAEDAIGAMDKEKDVVLHGFVSVQEHQEMAETIMDTMADVGARVSVKYRTIVDSLHAKDPHTVRACWL